VERLKWPTLYIELLLFQSEIISNMIIINSLTHRVANHLLPSKGNLQLDFSIFHIINDLLIDITIEAY